MCVRAESENDFSLHLDACYKMMPYFFAAGHVNYAPYSLCYLQTMHKLPGIVLDAPSRKCCCAGCAVVRHQDGHWNGI